MEELKEQLHRIEASITDVDTLLRLKHNTLNEKIDNLCDRVESIEKLSDKTADAVLDQYAMLTRVEEKLDRVLAYIDKVESPQYTQNADAKEMFINLLANAVITRMFGNLNGNNTL